jgi:hypothetical protein
MKKVFIKLFLLITFFSTVFSPSFAMDNLPKDDKNNQSKNDKKPLKPKKLELDPVEDSDDLADFLKEKEKVVCNHDGDDVFYDAKDFCEASNNLCSSNVGGVVLTELVGPAHFADQENKPLNLLSLPEDVLRITLKFVAEDPDFCKGVRSLMAAGQTCKALNKLTEDESFSLEKLNVVGNHKASIGLAVSVFDISQRLVGHKNFINFIGEKNIKDFEDKAERLFELLINYLDKSESVINDLKGCVDRYKEAKSISSKKKIVLEFNELRNTNENIHKYLPAEFFYLLIKIGQLINVFDIHFPGNRHINLNLNITDAPYVSIALMFDRRNESIRQRKFSVRMMNGLRRVGHCLQYTGKKTLVCARKAVAIYSLLIASTFIDMVYLSHSYHPRDIYDEVAVSCLPPLFVYLFYKLW